MVNRSYFEDMEREVRDETYNTLDNIVDIFNSLEDSQALSWAVYNTFSDKKIFEEDTMCQTNEFKMGLMNWLVEPVAKPDVATFQAAFQRITYNCASERGDA